MRLILASASPRRRELLALMGIEFESLVSKVDERTIQADHPRTFAIRAAYAKACDVAASCEDGQWVLAADTVVTRRSILFGKPETPAEARSMLESLSGTAHDVITGIALTEAGSMKSFLHAERTAVHFRALTPEEIDAYIQSGEPFDKAGGYGIQGMGGSLVERIDGDYFNVVGLPCAALVSLMDEAGLDIQPTIPPPPEKWR